MISINEDINYRYSRTPSVCQYKHQYLVPFCNYLTDSCENNPCGENGVCEVKTNEPSSFTCQCINDYTGELCLSEFIMTLGQQKTSLWFLVIHIGRLQTRCGDAGFFKFRFVSFLLTNKELRDVCICGDQISHIQSMVAKKGHSTAEVQSIQQFWLQLDIVS